MVNIPSLAHELSNVPETSPGLSQFYLDSQWGNFKLFGLIYSVYPKKFELFGA